jgi:hypothetical protein
MSIYGAGGGGNGQTGERMRLGKISGCRGLQRFEREDFSGRRIARALFFYKRERA